MIKRFFCVSIIALGSLLEVYFYVFRFRGDGMFFPVAIVAAVALCMLLAFSVYNKIKPLTVAIIIFSTAQTSVGQTFSLLEHNAKAGTDTTSEMLIAEHKKNIDRLSLEADNINDQLRSLSDIASRSNYGRTVSGATSRLDRIHAERLQSIKAIQELTQARQKAERDIVAMTSIYDFYASMPKWSGMDWLKFVFHSFLSVLIALMTPIGIMSWETKEKKPKRVKLTPQEARDFVTVAWHKVRNKTGREILPELSFDDLCMRREIKFLLVCIKYYLTSALSYGL